MKARYCKRVGEALLLPGTVACLVSVCSLAHAQAWLPDRDYKEGPGIKAGNMELHGGVAARGGWNSNVFFSDGDEVPRRGSGMITVTPHFHIATRGGQRAAEGETTKTAPPKIRLRAGGDADVVYYTLDEAPTTNVNVGLDGALQIMPERPMSGQVSVDYRRRFQPFTEFAAGQAYLRNMLTVGGLLRFQSKGGVLQGSIGYKPQIDMFGKDTPFAYLNGTNHTVPATMAWKFLPHTALLYDGRLGFKRYQDPVNEDPQASVFYTDSTNVQSRIGLNGALTNRLTLRLMAGAAFGFYDPVDTTMGVVQLNEYQEPIAEATLSWRFSGRGNQLGIGYERQVSPSYVGGWMGYDVGNVTLKLAPASVVSLEFQVRGGQYRYGDMLNETGGDLGEGGTRNRKDLRLNAAVRAEYRVTNWLAFMVDATVLFDDTSFSYQFGSPASAVVDPAGYTVFRVFGGVRAHY